MNHRHRLGLGLLTLAFLLGQTMSASAANLEEQLDLRPNNATRGQSRDVADGWMQLGNQQQADGDLAAATVFWAEAAEIYRLLGDTQSAGRAYGSMGAAFGSLGRYPEAERAFVLRLGTARDNDDRLGQVYGLNNLGNLYVNQGRLNEGQTHFEEAFQIARTTGDAQALGATRRPRDDLDVGGVHARELGLEHDGVLLVEDVDRRHPALLTAVPDLVHEPVELGLDLSHLADRIPSDDRHDRHLLRWVTCSRRRR